MCYLRYMKKYFRHKIENLISIKNILTIEYLNLHKDYYYPSESHNFWELVYADRESVFCVAEGKTVKLQEGEILFHRPNVNHSIYTDQVNAPAVFIMCFDCNSSAMTAFNNYTRPLNKHNKNLLSLIIEEMKRTFMYPFEKKLVVKENPSLGGQEAIRIYLELLLIYLLREIHVQSGSTVFLNSQNYESQLIGLIIEYLKENVPEKLTVEQVCKKFNYSKSYISRIFKEVTGKTIIEYFNFLKMEEAKHLLALDISIKEIAERLSYNDPHYLTYQFKKTVGISPSKFIKSIER